MDISRETVRWVEAFLAVFVWAPGYAETRVVRAALFLATEFGVRRPSGPAEWLACPPAPESVDPARVPVRLRATLLRVCRQLCVEAPHPERYATLFLLEDLWNQRSPAPAQAEVRPTLAVA